MEEASPINFLSQGAPPILCVYSKSRNYAPDIHHPRYGDDLKERMDSLDLECTVIVDEELLNDMKFPQKSGQGVKQVSIFQSYLDCDSPSMNAA